jgi:hypothetical protein
VGRRRRGKTTILRRFVGTKFPRKLFSGGVIQFRDPFVPVLHFVARVSRPHEARARLAEPVFGRDPLGFVAMDLLAAEIAKKRKANALLSAVGGVGKYAKKGAKEEAARVAAAVTGLGDSSGAVDVTTGLDVVTTTGDTDGASLKRDGDAGGTTPTHNNDHHSKQEPHDDVAKLDETECIRRLRLLKAPATLFGEDEFARRARFRNVIATVIVRDEHATGGQQANERKRVLDELAKEEKLRFERLGMEDGIGRGRKGTALGDLDGTGPAGPSSARDGSINTEDTETQGNEKEEDLDDVFAAAAKRVKAAAEANAKVRVVRFPNPASLCSQSRLTLSFIYLSTRRTRLFFTSKACCLSGKRKSRECPRNSRLGNERSKASSPVRTRVCVPRT